MLKKNQKTQKTTSVLACSLTKPNKSAFFPPENLRFYKKGKNEH